MLQLDSNDVNDVSEPILERVCARLVTSFFVPRRTKIVLHPLNVDRDSD
jgi:hypothetical protein